MLCHFSWVVSLTGCSEYLYNLLINYFLTFETNLFIKLYINCCPYWQESDAEKSDGDLVVDVSNEVRYNLL